MPETARLTMRPVSEGDATLYCELYGDPETMRFIGSPLSRERAQRSFRKAFDSLDRRPVERVLLVIVEKVTQRSIGIGVLQDFDPQRRRVEAGMMLGEDARGRGFGKEGLSALVSYAFATFQVDEVWIQHAADNANARRVPVSLGMVANADVLHGNTFVWSAQRESWAARHSTGG